MKKFDMKSFIAGIIIGTTGITTVFAASGIKSAHVSNMNVTLNGASFSLSKPLLSVTMENEQEIVCPECSNTIPVGTADVDELKF